MKTYRIKLPEDRGMKYSLFTYPAGELQVRIREEEFLKIAEADVVEVKAEIRDGQIMELALLSSALAGLMSPLTKTRLVLPYLPYSRADRRFVEGDCAALKTFGLFISLLGYDCVDTYDVHSPAAFDCVKNLVSIPPEDYIEQVVNHIGRKNLTILLPDKGAIRYEALVNSLGIKFTYGEKVRDAATGNLTGFKVSELLAIGKPSKVLIIDDICDGGGTFIGLAKAVKEQNPDAVLYLYTTHGIFSKGMTELKQYFENVYATDTFKSQPFLAASKL